MLVSREGRSLVSLDLQHGGATTEEGAEKLLKKESMKMMPILDSDADGVHSTSLVSGMATTGPMHQSTGVRAPVVPCALKAYGTLAHCEPNP